MADIKVKQAAKKVAKMRHNLGKGRPKPKETSGEVKRIEGDVAYVRFDGSEIDTPVNISHACEVGERIRVKVGDDRHAWTMGNITSPPTDNKVANIARRVADRASDTAVQAEERAIEAEHNSESAMASAESAVGYSIEARKIAGNTNQYFWHKEQADPDIEDDETGAHITEVPQEEWEDPNSENYHSGGNLLARSNGIAIRDGLTELASFSANTVGLGESNNNKFNILLRKVPDSSHNLSGLIFRKGTDEGFAVTALNQSGSSGGLLAGENGYQSQVDVTASGKASMSCGKRAYPIGMWDYDSYIGISASGSPQISLTNSISDRPVSYIRMLGDAIYIDGSNISLDGDGNLRTNTEYITQDSGTGDILNINTSTATIMSAEYSRCDNIAQLHVRWRSKNNITYSSGSYGNITNITLGTLNSDKCPKMFTAAHSTGDNVGQQWYSISTNGNIILGALSPIPSGSRTIDASAVSSIFDVCVTYIV